MTKKASVKSAQMEEFANFRSALAKSAAQQTGSQKPYDTNISTYAKKRQRNTFYKQQIRVLHAPKEWLY
jgi:hypothetical protein